MGSSGKKFSNNAVWSLTRSFQEMVTAERCIKYLACSLAKARSMIELRDPFCDQVKVWMGLRTSRLLSSIQSWKALAQGDGKEWGRDQRGECVLKSPKKIVGMRSAMLLSKRCCKECPESGLS